MRVRRDLEAGLCYSPARAAERKIGELGVRGARSRDKWTSRG